MKLAIENIASINGEVAIAWKDGGESYLGFEDLRRACPCATCQGEPDAMGRVVRPEVRHEERSFTLTRFEIVPKALALRAPLVIARLTATPTQLTVIAFRPLRRFVTGDRKL